ncbi:MAG: CBS domain-containing protein [Thermodesulfobacteriota bacterium]|nr:CBS domain-containing protein [Thermodesulfobacteriota bacterium]
MDVITTHVNADFDSLASMLAAKKLYPQAVLVFPGSQEKNLRDFFIQSTFYVFETERIKNINLDDVRRLILVDTRQPGRIGKLAKLAQRPGVEVHIFDHHPASPDDLRGKVEHIREVGATMTILAHILKEKKIPLSAEEATVMALGLYEDTGSFTFSSTTTEDYEAAAFLLSQGANLNTVSSLITREITSEQISLLNELIQTATRYTVKGVEVVIAKASSNKYVGDFALLVHKLRDMENINVLFALAEMEDRIYLVARSNLEEVNVGEIAAAFGGGGHPTAASATIKGLNLPQVEEKLLSYLEGRVHPVRLARDLMSFPVKSVEATETIERAGELLTRYNINVLPVMDKGKIAGLISRQVIEKAAFHGFKNSPIRDYMSSEFASVHPRTALSKVQDLIVGNNQRFLPVLEKDNLVGAITRTDLLRWLYTSANRPPHTLVEQDLSSIQPKKKWILQLMEERLPLGVLALLKTIGEKSQEMGFQVYTVGGFVRDLILRYENYDIDVVVEGEGIQLAQALAEEGKCEIQAHKKFGTATLFFPQGRRLDVATARLEYYDHPAALPRVEHSSIKLDLFRRDFTVNALAVHLNPQNFGELIDFFGGQKDIKERRIRVLHNLSFVEDPTRIFRALRFEQRIGFQIAKHTHMLMENAVRMELFGRLSGKRLFQELVLCLKEEKPFAVIKRLADYGLLKFFHPKLKTDRGVENLFQRLESVLSWYNLLFTGERYERWLVVFLGLVDNLTEKELQELLSRLSLSEKFRAALLQHRRMANQVVDRMARLSFLRRSEIYFLLNPLPTDFLLFAMGKTDSEEVKKALSLYFTGLKPTKVSLSGKDLNRMGYPPGPIYTEIFQDLLRARLDGKLHSQQEEVEYVQQKFSKQETRLRV